MAYGKSRSKRGGFLGNMVKIGGARKKLSLKSDMRSDSLNGATIKKASKQAHKRA